METPLGTNEEILRAFTKEVTLENPDQDSLLHKRLLEDLVHEGELIAKKDDKLDRLLTSLGRSPGWSTGA